MKIAIIGAGAAGYFAAISCKNHFPEATVSILEKSNKTLAKVKISGGGRCNVTHACFSISELSKFYPRGEKHLKKSFGIFNTNHTVAWFNARGVELKTEADNRMFPITDNSQTIIDCLTREAEKLSIDVRLGFGVDSLKKTDVGFELSSNKEIFLFDKIIVATGGNPKTEGFNWLSSFNHEIIPPVPSLFTFNMPSEKTEALMGLATQNTVVRIQGTNLQQQGPLLITHWGMSGPAILKLSAWGARILNDLNYNFTLLVNWTGLANEEIVREKVMSARLESAKKKIINANPFDLTARMWEYLLDRVEIKHDIIWSELPKKEQNRLINTLFNDAYKVEGKTTFKEEFVTCGGISLAEVNMNTMESRKQEGLFFAGEVLDIDGVTGGFNFQAAWTTGFIAGKLGKG
jgi:predicted Rossmann fold flavoprotein